MMMPTPHRKRSRAGDSEGGFSLVEVLVVMAIVAGLVGVGAYMVDMVTAGDLKASARQMSSSIRYMYNQAAVNNTQYRMVIDLEANTYHTEIVQSALVDEFASDPEEDEELLTEEAIALAEKKKAENDLFDDEEDNPFGISRKVSYQRVQDAVMKPGKLKDGVKFTRVFVPAIGEVSAGRAYINFYPNGFQDPLIIHLEDSRGAIFSLQTEPLTGRVLLFSDEILPSSDFGLGEDDD
jgi:general secretion pathway protein H